MTEIVATSKSRRSITQQELRDRFDYNPSTGALTTKPYGVGRSFRRGGRVTGYTRKDGYVHVQVGAQSYYAHRLIWCWVTGEWPNIEIDHINYNRSDNRWGNLRKATPSQNAFARRYDNVLRGIELMPNGKFRARIGVNRRHLHLGCFDSADDAIAVREKVAFELFGSFSIREA